METVSNLTSFTNWWKKNRVWRIVKRLRSTKDRKLWRSIITHAPKEHGTENSISLRIWADIKQYVTFLTLQLLFVQIHSPKYLLPFLVLFFHFVLRISSTTTFSCVSYDADFVKIGWLAFLVKWHRQIATNKREESVSPYRNLLTGYSSINNLR